MKHVDYEVKIESGSALVKLTQTYVNPEERDIDVMYRFPINNDLVFYDFQAEFNGDIIKGQIMGT